MNSRYPYPIVPINESPAERDARHAYERAKKRRDDFCNCHITITQCGDTLREAQFLHISAMLDLPRIALEERMVRSGIEYPEEEVCAYIREDEVCRICALSDANCKCSRDDVRTDSSALAERG